MSPCWLKAQVLKKLVKRNPVNKLMSLIPCLGPQEQLSEVWADSTQHSGMRPPQLFSRVPGIESHIGELHATLQQPLHVLGEAGLLYPDWGESS